MLWIIIENSNSNNTTVDLSVYIDIVRILNRNLIAIGIVISQLSMYVELVKIDILINLKFKMSFSINRLILNSFTK